MRVLFCGVLRIAILVAALCGVARADEVMYWCDGDANVKVTIARGGTCGSFDARDASGKVVQHGAFDFTASGHLYATADGHTVVYLAGSPGDLGTIAKPAVAKGDVKGALTFQIAKGVALTDDTSGITVCLTGSPRGWLAIDKLDVMYNALPTR
ncbi:MAG TPA: hypothetical protein VF516_08680 [Kofleriaceae bacterium]